MNGILNKKAWYEVHAFSRASIEKNSVKFVDHL